jgi:hypothetical protein
MIAELYLQSFKKKASADIAIEKAVNSKTVANISLKKILQYAYASFRMTNY